jgi:hypothetical protein
MKTYQFENQYQSMNQLFFDNQMHDILKLFMGKNLSKVQNIPILF